MRPFRPALAAILLLAGLAGVPAGALARPPLPILREGGIEYVRARDVAEQLGLRERWIGPHRLELSDAAHSLELNANRLDALVDGLRVDLGEPAIERGAQLCISRIDFERRLLPLLRPQLLGPPPRVPRTIVIDPGHGGWDPGMQNTRLRMSEKTYTLDVGLRLRRLLEARGYRVLITRSRDQALEPTKEADLRRRTEIAVLNGADLFLSIHFNSSSPDTRTHGTEVWAFPPRSQPSTNSWVNRKDDRERIASPVNQYDCWSFLFAHAMHAELIRDLHTEDRGEKLNQLGVLRGLHCPGILVETAYLSNDAEARRVADPAFRQQIAEAMLAGIERYTREIEALRPPPTRRGGADLAARPDRAAGGLQPPTRPGN